MGAAFYRADGALGIDRSAACAMCRRLTYAYVSRKRGEAAKAAALVAEADQWREPWRRSSPTPPHCASTWQPCRRCDLLRGEGFRIPGEFVIVCGART
jgi:hypothetical protein